MGYRDQVSGLDLCTKAKKELYKKNISFLGAHGGTGWDGTQHCNLCGKWHLSRHIKLALDYNKPKKQSIVDKETGKINFDLLEREIAEINEIKKAWNKAVDRTIEIWKIIAKHETEFLEWQQKKNQEIKIVPNCFGEFDSKNRKCLENVCRSKFDCKPYTLEKKHK